MKLILLAAAVIIATPAIAQQTPPADPAAAPAAAPAAPAAADPVGGYQPSKPALSGPAAPGVTPQFVQAPPPDQAYPAPAPLAHYPICKRGQFDKCMERGSPK